MARQLKGVYRLWTRAGDCDAVAKRSLGRLEPGFPVVGDWVAFVPAGPGSETGQIRAVLERRTRLSRKAAGETTEEQIVAANVDTVFLVTGLDGDFNPRRLERFLIAVHESGAEPVVVLNKADLVENAAKHAARTQEVAPGVAVRVVSATTGRHLDDLEPWLVEGRTVGLVGSSGAGKSTLLNALVGERVMETGAVRGRDDRGQHTTSFRQLARTPGGALLLDTPGVREMQVWSAELGGSAAFRDIDEVAEDCRFRDCTHGREPGCAVRSAVAANRLSAGRVDSYLKLRGEQSVLEERKAERAQMQAAQRGRVRQHRR